jgi:hypothetical protein
MLRNLLACCLFAICVAVFAGCGPQGGKESTTPAPTAQTPAGEKAAETSAEKGPMGKKVDKSKDKANKKKKPPHVTTAK